MDYVTPKLAELGRQLLGEANFNAYNVAKGGKTWDGKDIPPWAELGAEVQAGWIAGAMAVGELVAQARMTKL